MLDLNWYQQELGLFLKEHRHAIGLLPPRAGKTRATLAACQHPNDGAILVLAPRSALIGWRRECNAFYDSEDTTIIENSAATRSVIWQRARQTKRGLYIATYDTYVRDYVMAAAVRWDSIVLDEAHRIVNRKTVRFKKTKQLRADQLFMITGTIKLTEGPQNLWTLLYLCDRKRFASYWKFVDTYCYVIDGPFGKEVTGARNVVTLRAMLREYIYYRTRAEIWPDMPVKNRMKLPVVMTSYQARLYSDLRDNMMAELTQSIESDIVVVSNVLTQMVRLRQILVTPKLIEPGCKEYGGGIEAIADQLEDLNDDQVVICTPFPSAMPYITERIGGIRNRSVVEFRGGISTKEQEEAERKFNSEPCVALCSIRFAQGFSLKAAANSFFLGCDWDPDENYQAEDRLYDLDVTTARNIAYITYEGTTDERVFEVLDRKVGKFNQVFGSRNSLCNLLKNN